MLQNVFVLSQGRSEHLSRQYRQSYDTRSWVLCARITKALKPLKCIWLWVCKLSVVVYLFHKREDNWKRKFVVCEFIWSRRKWYSPRGRQYTDGEGAQRQGQPRHCKITPALRWPREGLSPQGILWGMSWSLPGPVAWPGLGVGAKGCWAEPCCRPIAQRWSSLIT